MELRDVIEKTLRFLQDNPSPVGVNVLSEKLGFTEDFMKKIIQAGRIEGLPRPLWYWELIDKGWLLTESGRAILEGMDDRLLEKVCEEGKKTITDDDIKKGIRVRKKKFKLDLAPPCIRKLLLSLGYGKRLDDVKMAVLVKFLSNVIDNKEIVALVGKDTIPEEEVNRILNTVSQHRCAYLRENEMCFPDGCKRHTYPWNVYERNAAAKDSKGAWNEMMDIEKFVVFPGSKTYYEVHVTDRITVTIEDADILSPNKFVLQYFNQTGIMLPPIKAGPWREILTHWRQTKGMVEAEKTESISDEEEIVNLVLNYIQNSRLVNDKKYAYRDGFVYVEGSSILVPNTIIRNLVDRSGYKNISLRKLSHQLKDWLKRGSKVEDVGGKKERFWVFDNKKFGLDTSDVIDFEEDKDAKS